MAQRTQRATQVLNPFPQPFSAETPMRSKVTIVGVGNVGASCALWLAKRGIADLVLVDIPLAKTMPVGKGLDLLQAAPIEGFNVRIKGNADGSYEGTEKSDIVIITRG